MAGILTVSPVVYKSPRFRLSCFIRPLILTIFAFAVLGLVIIVIGMNSPIGTFDPAARADPAVLQSRPILSAETGGAIRVNRFG